MTQKIDPQYVRFDTAKLLKEKGFANIQIDYGLNQMLNQSNPPEQWQVVEWLRVNHGIWISVQPNEPFTDNDWCNKIYTDLKLQFAFEGYSKPQEATEAAIFYVLNKLI